MGTDVSLTLDDGVALITFNRPEQKNTLNSGMVQGLSDAYRCCDEDDGVRAVVVTGSGDSFCAGADLGDGTAFGAVDDAGFSSCPLDFQAYQVRKPVIAACNGHAIGVGLGIATQCDLRILADDALYGFLQVRRGVVADFGSHYLLPRLLGLEAALEMLTLGRRYTGNELLAMGFCRRALPAEKVLPEALALAREYAENCSPVAVAQSKRLLWTALDQARCSAEADETAVLTSNMGSPDALEGGMAFFERRAPRWVSSVGADCPQILRSADTGMPIDKK